MIKARGIRARLTAAAAGLTAMCAGILAPGQPALAATYVPVSGAGSTWAYNAIHQWIANVAPQGLVVNYAPVGDTAGRSEFKQGTVDWAASEIPYGLRDGSNFDPPTDTSFGLTSDKGYTLGAFGQYLLCQGQQNVDKLGYAALPINLVKDGFARLQKIPGASVPTPTAAMLAHCGNPAISRHGTNLLGP